MYLISKYTYIREKKYTKTFVNVFVHRYSIRGRESRKKGETRKGESERKNEPWEGEMSNYVISLEYMQLKFGSIEKFNKYYRSVFSIK